MNSNLPCGTSDDILRVEGDSVSYFSYCQRSDMESMEKQIEVNSVFSHLWKDVKHSNGVTLTILDARYPEIAQRILHLSIAFARWNTHIISP